MRVFLELPRDWEVTELEISEDGRTIEMRPRFSTKSGTATVIYARAEGSAGRVNRAELVVSGKTGRFNTRGLVGNDEDTEFDAPEE